MNHFSSLACRRALTVASLSVTSTGALDVTATCTRCASGEARGGTRAPSDVEVELVTALEALKGVHTALVAAQLAAQSTEIRSA
jgi:hypothetical protein